MLSQGEKLHTVHIFLAICILKDQKSVMQYEVTDGVHAREKKGLKKKKICIL